MDERGAWQDYVATFHAERSGITEDVLDHALDQGQTPYDWLADAVPSGSVVLDLACGSGPLRSRLTPARYLGLDLSAGELAVAAARGLPVARADASRLPLAQASVDVVVMSMALMLVPLVQTLQEVRRVLRPGGLFAATVPSNRPMPAADWLRYARLCLAVRHLGLSYPNDAALGDAGRAFRQAGLRLVADEQRAFACRVETELVADQLLASLYLPGVSPDRMVRARTVIGRWVGSSVATPIRRLVAARI